MENSCRSTRKNLDELFLEPFLLLDLKNLFHRIPPITFREFSQGSRQKRLKQVKPKSNRALAFRYGGRCKAEPNGGENTGVQCWMGWGQLLEVCQTLQVFFQKLLCLESIHVELVDLVAKNVTCQTTSTELDYIPVSQKPQLPTSDQMHQEDISKHILSRCSAGEHVKLQQSRYS